MQSKLLALLQAEDQRRPQQALSEDVVFHSPVRDYHGRADVTHILSTIAKVLDQIDAIREFADRAIPDADLDRVLEAGRIAPSSQNHQPWDFVVVTDREMLRELSKVWRGGGHIANAAAAIAIVIPDEEEPRARERNRFDIGQAAMQMMIAAADRGIGSGHSAVGDQDAARSVLHVPQDKLVAFVIDLGYPADRPLRPGTRLKRRFFEEVVHRNGW